MILFTITPPILDGLEKLAAQGIVIANNPSINGPISRSQIVSIWNALKEQSSTDGGYVSLDQLMRGTRIYIPPPPSVDTEWPSGEPDEDTKEKIRRLRAQAEEVEYQRMLGKLNDRAIRVTKDSAVTGYIKEEDVGINHATYGVEHKEFGVIMNMLLTAFGVAASVWVLSTRYLSIAHAYCAILALLAGAGMLVAEVFLYSRMVHKVGVGIDRADDKVKARTEQSVDTGFKDSIAICTIILTCFCGLSIGLWLLLEGQDLAIRALVSIISSLVVAVGSVWMYMVELMDDDIAGKRKRE